MGIVTALVVATAVALVMALLERASLRGTGQDDRTWGSAPPVPERRERRKQGRVDQPARRRRWRARPVTEARARGAVAAIRPTALSAVARDEYLRRWRYLLSRFVEEPKATTEETYDLARKLLAERGYPLEDLDRDDVGVPDEHLALVANYRIAHHVASGLRSARTEALRRAMLHLRVVLEELLADPPYDLKVRPRRPGRRKPQEDLVPEREARRRAPDVDRYRVVVTDEGPQPPSEDHMWGGPT